MEVLLFVTEYLSIGLYLIGTLSVVTFSYVRDERKKLRYDGQLKFT